MPSKLKIRACEFLLRSDVFKGCGRLFAVFADSDLPFTFGDNARSLVTVATLLLAVDQAGPFAGPVKKQHDTVKKRLEPFAPALCIDLEN